jgi:hypothetical protein
LRENDAQPLVSRKNIRQTAENISWGSGSRFTHFFARHWIFEFSSALKQRLKRCPRRAIRRSVMRHRRMVLL